MTTDQNQKYLNDASYLTEVMGYFKAYVSQSAQCVQALHTSMCTFQRQMMNMASADREIGASDLQKSIANTMYVFARTHQQLSEMVYTVQQELHNVNQNIDFIQNDYLFPLTNSLKQSLDTSLWGKLMWWSKPREEYSDRTKIELALTRGDWEFKLSVGSLIESIQRVLHDESINAKGDCEFTREMTQTRIEKSQYTLKYKGYRGYYRNRSLNDILKIEGRSENSIPKSIETIIGILSKRGYDSDGIFRVAANTDIVTQVYNKLGDNVDFDGMDFNLLACVLKRFCGSLPQKIFSRDLTNKVLQLKAPIRTHDINSVLSELPRSSLALLKEVCKLLFVVSSRSDVNKMNASNLAIVWSPNLFDFSLPGNPADLMQMLNALQTFLGLLITRYDTIFPNEIDRKSVRLSQSRLSFHARTSTSTEKAWSRSSEMVSEKMKKLN